MASHSQNIEALRTAVYGEQVRGAMIELFEEDYTMVNKGIGVGTDVTSSSSPVTGYVDGNVYINSETLDIWKTDGSVWDNKGNLKGIADIEVDESTEDAGENVVTITLTNGTSKTFSVLNGSKGSTGVSIVNAVDDGQGKFHLTKSDGTNTAQIQTVKGDKGDKGDKGEKGDDGERGRSVSSILMSGTGKSHPITATYSDGSSAVVGVVQDGADGQGTGDMTKATYDVNDNGYVDAAAALTDGTNIMPYSTVANKADKSTTLSGYGITNAYTKTEVNTALTGKVSEPTSDGSDGQALMTDGQGGRTWGNPNYVKSVESTQLDVNASGKLSLASQITSKLSHIEESDAWNATKSDYKSGDVVIYNNAMYAVKDNISAVPVGTLPTNTTYYEPYSISALKSSLANIIETLIGKTTPIDVLSHITIGTLPAGITKFECDNAYRYGDIITMGFRIRANQGTNLAVVPLYYDGLFFSRYAIGGCTNSPNITFDGTGTGIRISCDANVTSDQRIWYTCMHQ